MGSNIESPDWIKNKRATMNPINNDGKFDALQQSH